MVRKKKIKISLNMHLGIMFFLKFLKCRKLTHIKKFNFQHYRETKILPVIVFWSNYETDMLQNVEFRLNHEIQKVLKKPLKIEMPQKYHAAKILCLKQKQSPRGAPRKRCSENMRSIYRGTPIMKCNFNKIAL